MRGCAEGTTCDIAEGQEMAFLRLTHFGGWLRIRRVDNEAASPKVIVYIVLK